MTMASRIKFADAGWQFLLKNLSATYHGIIDKDGILKAKSLM